MLRAMCYLIGLTDLAERRSRREKGERVTSVWEVAFIFSIYFLLKGWSANQDP